MITPFDQMVVLYLKVCYCWLRACCQPASPDSFLRCCFPAAFEIYNCGRYALSQVQSLAFVLVQFHAIDDCWALQSIHIPLQGLLSLESVSSTSHFSIISKLANSAFDSCLQITDKNFEQKWPRDWALRNTTGDWSPARCSPTLYNP